MAKMSLLNAKSKTGFQSFVLAVHYWEMRPGRSSNLNEDVLRELMKCNACKSCRDLAHVNPQPAATWKKIRKVNKLGVSIPRTLSEKNEEIAYS